jgi:tRNA-splicing ligase RtcB
MKYKVFGTHDNRTIEQLERCLSVGNVVGGVLCADGHVGYSQPIGGVVVYKNQVSPSGVGYDIACGNKAVRTNLKYIDIKNDINKIMDEIQKNIAFGVGRSNDNKIDHALFDDQAWNVYKDMGGIDVYQSIKALAQNQLGTVGSGNHFVDIFVEESTQDIWVANHFGSRGFGHKTASGFLNLAVGKKFTDKAAGESMEAPPTLLDLGTDIGDAYMEAMRLAGLYAYAGRDYVIDQVLNILSAKSTLDIHNHHNYAWKEIHNGEECIVVRKGATPSAPNQVGFIGGSMGDFSVIVKGKDTIENKESFYSTVHGAGRIMSRTEAAGKMDYKTRTRKGGGAISPEMMQEAINNYGVTLRGAGTDESPFVYKKLSDVLFAHSETIEILYKLRPIGVCMAGENEFDPYKD